MAYARIVIHGHMCSHGSYPYSRCTTHYVAHILREGAPAGQAERTVCGLELPVVGHLDEHSWRFLAWVATEYARDESGRTLAEVGAASYDDERALAGSWYPAAHTGCTNCWLNYRE